MDWQALRLSIQLALVTTALARPTPRPNELVERLDVRQELLAAVVGVDERGSARQCDLGVMSK